jgi:cell division control protein 6
MDALQPVVDGWEPNNIFLYGNTGVGKTAVTDYLLDRLQNDVADYDDIDLSVISVNCKTLNSSYQVTVELVNKLRPAGGEISSTGYPQQTVFKKLYEELKAIGGTILIVLDEVDSIGDRDELLYELPRARANNNLDSAKVGVIGISNDFKFREQLDPRVQDTLCERELQFPPYDAPELENILESRAEIAIAEGAIQQGVLNFCAALAARDSGSARQALDLLRLAGEIAENREADRIKRDHVELARSRLEQERVETGMRELTAHGRLTLLAVISKAAKEETPCRTREIYEEYTTLCDSSGTDPLAHRSVHNHLSDLRMLGILSAHENRSGSRGNYYSYELDVPFTSAIEAMSDVLRLDSEIETIREIASMNDVA